MLTVRKFLPGIALALAIAAAATPSLAQRGEPNRTDSSRERAMHDCNVEANKMTQSTSATVQLNIYRSCMMQHGQSE
jgi:hypothetical protein